MWKLQWCTYFQVCLLCVKRICGYLQHILLSFCCVLNLFSNALPDESNVWLTDSVRIVIAAAAIEPWVTHYLPRWSLSEGLSSWPTLTSTKHAMKPPRSHPSWTGCVPRRSNGSGDDPSTPMVSFLCWSPCHVCWEAAEKMFVQGYRIKCRRPMNSCLKL